MRALGYHDRLPHCLEGRDHPALLVHSPPEVLLDLKIVHVPLFGPGPDRGIRVETRELQFVAAKVLPRDPGERSVEDQTGE